MTLNAYAKRAGVRYETTWRWFKRGLIAGTHLPTGTILITEDAASGLHAPERWVVYARVSAQENRHGCFSRRCAARM